MLVEERRTLFRNENVVAVLLTVGDKYWIGVVPGSFTDDPDPTIKGTGGQVSFLTRDRVPNHLSPRLILTYTHFIAAVKYNVQEKENKE